MLVPELWTARMSSLKSRTRRPWRGQSMANMSGFSLSCLRDLRGVGVSVVGLGGAGEGRGHGAVAVAVADHELLSFDEVHTTMVRHGCGGDEWQDCLRSLDSCHASSPSGGTGLPAGARVRDVG